MIPKNPIADEGVYMRWLKVYSHIPQVCKRVLLWIPAAA
jgi:hypothetical protein